MCSDASCTAWLFREDPNRLCPCSSAGALYILFLHYSDATGGLYKICIVGSTFATYYSDIIEVGSYIVSIVETFANVLVFAHGPHFYYALTAHGIG